MKKVIKWIAVAFIFIGFMFLLGTAGASDAGTVKGIEILTRCLCGLGMMGAGTLVAYILD